jgi:hypothetical protein
MNKRHRKRNLPPFVPLFKSTLDTPAWRATSHGARSLYVALKRFWNAKADNNGRIYLSTRDAAAEIGSSQEECVKWYLELQHYGFIVKTTEGRRGSGGFAPHWRLTEIGCNGAPPTVDFIKWGGITFRPPRRPSRGSKNRLNLGKAKHPATERLSIVGSAENPLNLGKAKHSFRRSNLGKAKHTNTTTPCPEVGPCVLTKRRITKVGNGSRAIYVEHDDDRCYQFREEGQDWQPCQLDEPAPCLAPALTIPGPVNPLPLLLLPWSTPTVTEVSSADWGLLCQN